MTASTSTVEIEEYCDAVRAALADLPADDRDDLLEDLPDHLAEVRAEGEGTLRERLGEPTAYAAELRAAAGLLPVEAAGEAADRRPRMRDAVQRASVLAGRLDRGMGRFVGYPRLQDLLRAARPGWWLLRGWIVAQFVCGTRNGGTWHGVIPTLDGGRGAGIVVLIVAVVASVWFGRQTHRFRRGWRAAVTVAGLVIAVWGAFLAAHVNGNHSTYVSVGDGSGDLTSGVSDVYVFDQAGNLVPGARLYDQDGNSVQLGNQYCDSSPTGPGVTVVGPGANGDRGAGVDANGNVIWTYPLCPNDPGPFRSGPGPVVSAGAVPPATSSAPAPATSAPAPTASAPAGRATPTPSAKPVPTASPTPAPTR